MTAKRKPIGHALDDYNLEPPDDEVTCRTCDGEGREIDEERGRYGGKCRTCKGSGTVPADYYEDDE